MLAKFLKIYADRPRVVFEAEPGNFDGPQYRQLQPDEPKSNVHREWNDMDLGEIANRVWVRFTASGKLSASPVTVAAASQGSPADQWSAADVSEVLCAVEAALRRCNEMSDLGSFKDRVRVVVRKKLLCRAARTSTTACPKSTTVGCTKSTSCTKSSTCSTTEERTPEHFGQVLDAVVVALRQCNDVNQIEDFLDQVGIAVQKETQRRTATVKRCTTPKTCGDRRYPRSAGGLTTPSLIFCCC